MTEALATNSKPRLRPAKAAAGRLFVLELSGGRIHSMSPDGSDRKVIVTDCHLPDGIVVDVEAGHIYWTNMGSSPTTNDGSIERADIDGKEPQSHRSAGCHVHAQSRSSSIRKTASSTGATARACA